MITPEAPPVEAPCPDLREIRELEDRRYQAMLRGYDDTLGPALAGVDLHALGRLSGR